MGNALVKKSKSEETTSMVLGIVAIFILTMICYIVGYVVTQSEGFVNSTSIHFIFKRQGFRYLSSAFSMIVAMIMYAVKFKNIAGRDSTKFSFIEKKGGADFVLKGWTPFAFITGCVTLVVGFIIHMIAFQGTMILVKPLMIWVLLAQAVSSIVVFKLPFCQPLKKA